MKFITRSILVRLPVHPVFLHFLNWGNSDSSRAGPAKVLLCTLYFTVLLVSGCASPVRLSDSKQKITRLTDDDGQPAAGHNRSGDSLEKEETDWLNLEPGQTNHQSAVNPGAPAQDDQSAVTRLPLEKLNLEQLNLEQLNRKLYSVNAVQLAAGTLLYSLAKESKLEMVIRGDQSLPVTVRVENRPLAYILDNIASQAKLRWQLNDDVIEVGPDNPYLKIYDVDYLNLTRIAKGSVGLATQVGSIALDVEGEGTGNGFTNNSQVLIENESRHQFWESIEEDLSRMLSSQLDTGQSLSVNRDAGLVSLNATHSIQQAVENYLHKLQRIAMRQVLIEAIVVEVSLSDRFQAGIDWRAEGPGLGMAQVFHGQPEVNEGAATKLPAPTALVSAIHNSSSLGRISATLDLLNEFGEVKILSRPQIIAINNQSAVLKVVDNRVYFTMTVERHSSDGEEDIKTATEIHTVPVGLVMNVTPFIGKNNNVILSVRPTISRILGFVNDPNPELANAKVQNGVPEIQVREMESVLRVGDGEIVMIGGLMQDQHNDNHQNVPWLSELPLIGAAFKRRKKMSKKTELLVFLQPTVMDAM